MIHVGSMTDTARILSGTLFIPLRSRTKKMTLCKEYVFITNIIGLRADNKHTI